MAQEIINPGTGSGTQDGDLVRAAFVKTKNNFSELFEEHIQSVSNTSSSSITSTTYLPISLMEITADSDNNRLCMFNSQINLPATLITTTFNSATAKTDLNSVYTDLNNITVTDSTHAAAFGGGETLTPNVFSVTPAITISGGLTFDAEGDQDAVFIIKSGAAISAAASTTVTLINGARARNIFWIAEGAIGIGATCIIAGCFISNTAAISVGANCAIDGRLYTKAGAIGFGAGILTITIASSVVDFRELEKLVSFSGIGNINNVGNSTYTGDISTDNGTLNNFSVATVNGTLFPSGSTSTVTEFNPSMNFAFFKNDVLIASSERLERKHLRDAFTVSSQVYITGVSTGDVIKVKCKIDNGIVTFDSKTVSIIRS